jgi:hypothetical protein
MTAYNAANLLLHAYSSKEGDGLRPTRAAGDIHPMISNHVVSIESFVLASSRPRPLAHEVNESSPLETAKFANSQNAGGFVRQWQSERLKSSEFPPAARDKLIHRGA